MHLRVFSNINVFTSRGCRSHVQPPTWGNSVPFSSGPSPLICPALEAQPVATLPLA
jgi:hypothetical protein